jgi:hypothetical protein
MIDRGKTVQAARIIMRAWVNFKFAKRLQVLMDRHRIKLYNDKVHRTEEARNELLTDIEDINNDIAYAREVILTRKTRLQELTEFQRQARLRVPWLKQELANLSEEDHEKGTCEYDSHILLSI